MGSEEYDRHRKNRRSFRLCFSLFVHRCCNVVSEIFHDVNTTSLNDDYQVDEAMIGTSRRRKGRKRHYWWLPLVVAIIGIQTLWLLLDRYQRLWGTPPPEPPEAFPPIHEIRAIRKPNSPLVPFYSKEYNYGPYYKGNGKAFNMWPQHQDFPCGPLVSKDSIGGRSGTKDGFIYVKEMKTGSTTLAGVTARIALNAAKRKLQQQGQSVQLPATNTNSTEFV